MKKKTTRMVALALSAVTLLSLAACGKEKTDVQRNLDSTQGSNVENITLSEYLNSGETIWFTLQNEKYPAKDSKIGRFFVLEKNGDIYTSDGNSLTLGDISKMEDKDIVKLVKEEYESNFKKNYEDDLFKVKNDFLYKTDVLTDFLDNLEDFEGEVNEENFDSTNISEFTKKPIFEFLNKLLDIYKKSNNNTMFSDIVGGDIMAEDKENFDEFFNEMYGNNDELYPMTLEIYNEFDDVAQKILDIVEKQDVIVGEYKLAINTDATGNETETMTFAYKIPTFYSDELKYITLHYTSPVENANTNCGYTIYDSTYGGFNTDYSVFLTRIDSKYNFVLDDVNKSDVPVDVKVEELFE